MPESLLRSSPKVRIGVLLSLVILIGCPASPTATPPANPNSFSWTGEVQATVVRVSDGDTLDVIPRLQASAPLPSPREIEQTKKRIRLWGIDCPELRGQPYGNAAKDLTLKLSLNQPVTLLIKDTDRYGRKVAVVILPDKSQLNHRLVESGLAWWYRRYAPGDRQLEQLESAAKAAKRGLWVEPDPTPPWNWRRLKKSDSTKN